MKPIYTTDFLDLHHCDNMELMAQYPDNYFDLAIVDPPYGINGGVDNRNAIETKSANNLRKFARKGGMDWDREIPTKEYFNELFRVSKNQIIWGGNYFINYLKNTRCLICWNKMTYIPSMSQMEIAWTSFDRHTKYIKINSNQNDRIHISQKPVDLYDWIINNFTKKGEIILDTHFGSGSIALAVDRANKLDKMNLHLTACELDKDYIDKSIERISQNIRQTTMDF